MVRSRSFYLSLLGAVAWSTTAADTILAILDASSLPTGQNSSVGLAAAASALDILALGSVTLFSSQYAWTRGGIVKHSKKARRILAVCCVVLSVGALIVSLASIVTTRSKLSGISSSNPGLDWSSRVNAHIVIWVLACLSQTALYTSPRWCKPTPKALSVTISGPRDSVMSELRHSNPTQNLYMLEPTQPSSPLAALPSPTFSARSSQSLKSWRESLHQVVRPANSRSKLVKQPSSRSMYAESFSTRNASQTDGFDTWEPAPEHKEIAMQALAAASAHMSSSSTPQFLSAPTKGTTLETIPQSRPESPARALDGPFSSADEDLPDLSPPPMMKLDLSRPPSPSVSESHIHPLFRTESPTPPPAATPGTSIIASPLSDHMIPCPARPYSRMRSNSNLSHAASPSPLVHAQSFTRDRALSPQPNRPRSTSPVSREMTPPIPDFVLNSSPRSSLSSSRRKVNLQSDTRRNVSR